MAFEHGAKKIVLTCVSPSPVLFSQVRQFRAQILGHARVMAPRNADRSAEKTSEWLRENAEKADLLIVFFMSEKTASSATPPETWNSPGYAPTAEILHVSARELAELPGTATVLVGLFRASDRDELPNELAAYRLFDLSSNDAREALLCAVAHETVRPKRTSVQEAAGAIFKIIIGYVATIVGHFANIRESLVKISDTLATVVHYCMIIAVIVLLFTGFWSLLRLAVDAVAPTLELAGLRRLIEKLPGGRSRWVKAAVGVGAAAIVLISIQFMPKRLDAETLVDQHLRELATRLENSQAPNGGIREHPESGVTQAWVTAQAMTALLNAGNFAKIAPLDVQRAVTFFELTRIADVTLADGATEKLSAELASVLPQADFSKLPGRFNSLAMAAGAISRLGGRRELTAGTTRLVLAKTREHFVSSPSSEGWGYFEQFESGITEITAWVTLAQIQSLRARGRAGWTEQERGELTRRIKTSIASFDVREIPVGAKRSYSPVNDTSDPTFGRTYSTIMVLWALLEAAAPDLEIFDALEHSEIQKRITSIVDWLDREATEDGSGWKVNPSNPTPERPFIGLTNQTLCILARTSPNETLGREKLRKVKRSMLQKAPAWRSKAMNDNDRTHDSDRYLYPTRHVIESSTFLWYPWSVCAMRALSTDSGLTPSERQAAERAYGTLRRRIGEFSRFAQTEYNYVAAEGLVAFTWRVGAKERIGGLQTSLR